MPNVAALMERTLKQPFLDFVKEAGSEAASGLASSVQGVYLVGGQVRDLLLERHVYDIDLMVVGDARALAAHLAQHLGGSVRAATSFGTVKLDVPGLSADIAMARQESYERPGALPRVEKGDPKQDLARRDYTINAMAIDLWPARFGTLFDFYGGMRDITLKRLRVLHEQSFADDPTRILRGLRYEARLSFQFEARTAGLLTRDMRHLEAVSGARIRSELVRILREPSRALALTRAEQLGVLAAIHPALRVPKRVAEAMAATGDNDGDLHYFVALIGAGLTEEEARAVSARLEPPKEWTEMLMAGPSYRALSRLLEAQDLKPSEIVDILSPFPSEALRAQLAVAPPTLQRERLNSYLSDLQSVRQACTGDDLIEAGVPAGPLVGELLDELRRARLDGRLHSKMEEVALVKRRLPLLLARKSGEA